MSHATTSSAPPPFSSPMTSADFLFALPREMRYLDGFDYWGTDHMAIDEDEARALGYNVSTGMTMADEAEDDEVVSPFPATPPDQLLPFDPLITHSSTMKPNTPARASFSAKLAKHNNSEPDPLDLFNASLVGPSVLSPAGPAVPDAWVNSQASLVDHDNTELSTPRPVVRTLSSSALPDRPATVGAPSDTPPIVALAPDSAGTATSSLPPVTPPPFDSTGHYNGQPLAFACHPPSPSAGAAKKRDTLDLPYGSSSPSSPMSHVVCLVDSQAVDEDVIQAGPPDTLEPPLHVSVPIASLCNPALAGTPVRTNLRPSRFALRQREAPTAPSTGQAVTVSLGAQEDSQVKRQAPKAVDEATRALIDSTTMANAGEAASRPTGHFTGPRVTGLRDSPWVRGTSVAGEKVEATSPEPAVQGDMELDDKRWFLDHAGHNDSNLQFPLFGLVTPPRKTTLSSPNLAPPRTIPSSEIPGTHHSSPAHDTSTDETTESETTPTFDSRSKRRKALEARRLEKLGVKLGAASPAVEGVAEDNSPGRSGRLFNSRLKQRLIDGDIGGLRLGQSAADPALSGLIDFGSRSSFTEDHDSAVRGESSDPDSKTDIAKQASMEEESIFKLTPVQQSTHKPIGRGKTLPGRAPYQSRAPSRFVAPTPLRALPRNNENHMDKKRRRESSAVDHVPSDESAAIDKTKTAKIGTPSLDRLPLAPMDHEQGFTSIGETAKLRRYRTNAPASARGGQSSSSSMLNAGPSNSNTKPVKGKARKLRSLTVDLATGGARGADQPLVSGNARTDQAELTVLEEDDEEYVPDLEEESEVKKSEQKKQKKQRDPSAKQRRGYSDVERAILLDSWNGEDVLGIDILNAANEALVQAGAPSRTSGALKWFMKNTLREDFIKKYRLYPRGVKAINWRGGK